MTVDIMEVKERGKKERIMGGREGGKGKESVLNLPEQTDWKALVWILRSDFFTAYL
jgi:hypothetical protein